MDKIDYKSVLKEIYKSPPGKMTIVDVPKLNFLKVDGEGNPNTAQGFTEAIQALYTLAYTIKFICKKELENDFSVMPLEGLFWTESGDDFAKSKDAWLWTLMLMVPDFVTKDIFSEAVKKASEKKKLAALGKVRFGPYEEGRSAQVMYVGPYSGEGPTIERLHTFIQEQGGTLDASNKHHHEIYLGDPRRTAPSKLKTIIRQPF